MRWHKWWFHYVLRWLISGVFSAKHSLYYWALVLSLRLNKLVTIMCIWTKCTALAIKTCSTCIDCWISQKYPIFSDWKFSFSLLIGVKTIYCWRRILKILYLLVWYWQIDLLIGKIFRIYNLMKLLFLLRIQLRWYFLCIFHYPYPCLLFHCWTLF